MTFHFGPEGEEGMGLPMEKLKGGCQEKGRQKAFEEKTMGGGGRDEAVAPHLQSTLFINCFRSNVQ